MRFREALDEESDGVYRRGNLQSARSDIGNEATKLVVLKALPHDQNPTSGTTYFNGDNCDNEYYNDCISQTLRNDDYHNQDIASSYDYCDIKIFDDHLEQTEHQDHIDWAPKSGDLYAPLMSAFLSDDYEKDILGICFHRSEGAEERLAKLEA